jgi:hypothetical protein
MITPKSKPHCSWETSNRLFVSVQKEVLFFLKNKLSESKLNLNPKLRVVDDPQNLEHFSFKELKLLRSQTNVAWIDELLQISVAEAVVNLRKFADTQHRNSSKSKVNSLKLFKSNYSINLTMNSCKTGLQKKTVFNFASTVLRVQDVHQETQYLFNVFPNWTSQRRNNSNMIQQKNPN